MVSALSFHCTKLSDIEQVCISYKTPEELKEETREARELGFDGKVRHIMIPEHAQRLYCHDETASNTSQPDRHYTTDLFAVFSWCALILSASINALTPLSQILSALWGF